MKRDILQNKYRTSGLLKVLFADVVCFLVVAIFSVGFCYAYFSDKIEAKGKATTAYLAIDYRTNAADENTSTNSIYGSINGGAQQEITINTKFSPNDTLTIKGYAVNVSEVPVYVLARLKVETNKDTEVVWYNIAENKVLYMQKGLFQVGASVLDAETSKELSLPYVFEGERYTNDYTISNISLDLYIYQQDYLHFADDYDEYSATNGYSKDSIYAAHCMTGYKRDIWSSDDADIDGLTLADLEQDGSAYLINSCKDWMVFANNGTNQSFKLNAYLDFNNDTTTDKTLTRFSGILDGQGYTISNLVSTKSLLGQLSGTVSNLGIEGVSMSLTANGGVIASTASAGSRILASYVIGASVYGGATNDITSVGSIIVGGLVASLNGATISNSYAQLNIRASSAIVGGLVGEFGASSSSINNCYFKGNISGATAGLLVANIASNGTVNNSFAVTTSSTLSANKIVATYAENSLTNLVYIDNTGINNGATNYNAIVKVGQNQNEMNLIVSNLYSVGKLNKYFGWATSVWTTSKIYTTVNGLPMLRAFCNF